MSPPSESEKASPKKVASQQQVKQVVQTTQVVTQVVVRGEPQAKKQKAAAGEQSHICLRVCTTMYMAKFIIYKFYIFFHCLSKFLHQVSCW